MLLTFLVNRNWLFFWMIKRDIKITNGFQKSLNECRRNPKKIWVDKGSYLMKGWLQDKNIDMYSTHHGGKSAAAERLARTLKNKIYKYMISIAKNLYIVKLDDMVDE